MGFIKKEENNIVVCEHCSKGSVDLTFFKTDKGIPHFYCKQCVIAQYLMLCPIKLTKEQIDACLQDFIDLNRFNYVKEDEDRMNKFIDWIRPFLESKE